MAYSFSFQCCKADKYFCKCSGFRTELKDCSETNKEIIIKQCLADLKNVDEENNQILINLSSAFKENINNCGSQMSLNLNLDSYNKFRIVQSGIQKNSEIFMESIQNLNLMDEKQKIIKSFIKFLYQMNDRSKNKVLLTKFMYLLYSCLVKIRTLDSRRTLPPPRNLAISCKPNELNHVNSLKKPFSHGDLSILKTLASIMLLPYW